MLGATAAEQGKENKEMRGSGSGGERPNPSPVWLWRGLVRCLSIPNPNVSLRLAAARLCADSPGAVRSLHLSGARPALFEAIFAAI